MTRKKLLSTILHKNPHLDQEAIRRAIKLIRRMQAAGIRGTSPAAQPPVNGYSSYQ